MLKYYESSNMTVLFIWIKILKLWYFCLWKELKQGYWVSLVYVLKFDVKNLQNALKRISDMKKLYFKTTFIIISVHSFNGATGN